MSVEYVPNLRPDQIDALIAAMADEEPTGEEATRVIAALEMAWTTAALIEAVRLGRAVLQRWEDDTWYFANADTGEQVWELEHPERQS